MIERRPLRVLHAVGEPSDSTNPYLTQLVASLKEVDVTYFTWCEALLGHYDVLHIHWPEAMMRATTPLRSAAKCALAALLLVRTLLTGVVIVRTVHNDVPHESSRSLLEDAVTRAYARRTVAEIHLREGTGRVNASSIRIVVPHGHYIDHFAGYEHRLSTAGRVAFVGLVRPYKSVEQLLAAFGGMVDHDASLTISGAASSSEYAAELKALAARDPRVSLALEHRSDSDLVTDLTSASLIAVPYEVKGNSGVVLLALSLGRPVLTVESEATQMLAREVGERWVMTYVGPLTSNLLETALERADAMPEGAVPDLSERSWTKAGEQHVEVYAAAVGGRRKSWKAARRSRFTGVIK